MTEDLKKDIRAKVLQYLNFNGLETNKVEFKRQWYSLRDNKGLVEFLKDTTAIINSYGGDDAFIVFGVEDLGPNNANINESKLFNSSLSDSGYSDAADIKNIIDSNIDKPFRFDIDYIEIANKRLTVLHLPPSTDKPHVIIKFKDEKQNIHRNRIHVRTGSAKVEASKADLDKMYLERNTIIVERKADVAINFHGFRFSSGVNERENYSEHVLKRAILIENTGTRVLSIYKIRGDT